jgi:hypothetical protein
LFECKKFVSSSVFKVAIEVQCVHGLFESPEIVVVRMIFVFEDSEGPIAGIAAKIGDYEKNLLLVLGVGTGTHCEGKEAMEHECAVLRDLSMEFRGFANLRLTRLDGIGIRWRVLITRSFSWGSARNYCNCWKSSAFVGAGSSSSGGGVSPASSSRPSPSGGPRISGVTDCSSSAGSFPLSNH